jgi:creatinine amidohydrolase
MFLERMKWTEVDLLERAEVIVVIGIGAIEQHSLHMPIGTDCIIGTEVIRHLEQVLPQQLLCLPVIWAGCSAHHLGFAGTVSVSTTTLRAMLIDIVDSLRTHGFRKVLIINSHGGNRAAMACAIQDMGPLYADMAIAGVSYWDVAREELKEIRKTPLGGMGHACELETSILLSVAGELVDMSKARPDGFAPESRFTRGEMLSAPIAAFYRPVTENSHHGGYGDPTVATADHGVHILGLVTQGLVALCQDLLADRL